MKPGLPRNVAAERRVLLKLGLLGVAGLGTLTQASMDDETLPRNLPPQPGDHLAFADGDRAGQRVTMNDIPGGGPPIRVWPLEPGAGVMRDGRPTNALLLLRSMDPAAAPAAFSALCTHEGCVVDIWLEDEQRLYCPCHASEFDPFDGGAVVGGAARRRLPGLPLRLDEPGIPVVASGFTSRVYRPRKP